MKREKKTSNKVQNTKKRIDKTKPKQRAVSKNIEEKIARKNIFSWSAVILIITLAAYSLAFTGELTSWDDDEYVIKNPNLKELSTETVKNLFSEYYMGNYHPLAMLSLTIDYQFGGEYTKRDEKKHKGKVKAGDIKPFMFHFTNIILHLLITLLVLWFVYLLFKNFKVAVISTLLFGVSTLHVESVAWVAERKDVLYSLFFVASLISYLKYTENKDIKFYAFSLLLFILSLLSKGQAVSLAVTLIAIDIFRKRKLTDIKVILEKIPFLALAVIFGIIAVSAQKAGNAIVSEDDYNVVQRLGFAGYAFTNYLFQLTVPINLSAIYPYPDIINKTMPSYYYLYLIPAVIFGALYIYSFKKYPAFAFLMAFFIINIILLLQFIPVGSALHADRYAYISSIGFYTIFGLAASLIIENKKAQANVIYGVIGVYTIYMAVMTFQRTKVWQSSETLWTDTCEKSPKAVVAWNNLGSLLDKKAAKAVDAKELQKSIKIREEAIKDFTKAVKGKPDYVHAYYNRGSSKQEIAKITNDLKLAESAIEDFTISLKYDPLFSEGYHNRGVGLERLGKLDLAIKDFNQAIEIDKSNLSYFVNRGVAFGKSGKANEALSDFDYVIDRDPENYSAYSNRGLARNMLKQYDKAIKDISMAIEIKPDFTEAYINRAISEQAVRKYTESINDLNKALEIAPRNASAFYLRGVNYININQQDKACPDFSNAVKLGDKRALRYIQKYCSE